MSCLERPVFDEIADCFENAGSREEFDQCRKRAQEKIGPESHGSNRMVYEYDGCVVKFAMDPSVPNHSNIREIDVWQNAPTGIREYLVPVESHGKDKRWLTMKGIDVPQWNEVERGDPILDSQWDAEQDFEETLDENGWRCADVRLSNFGKDEGEWGFFDYADCMEF